MSRFYKIFKKKFFVLISQAYWMEAIVLIIIEQTPELARVKFLLLGTFVFDLRVVI